MNIPRRENLHPAWIIKLYEELMAEREMPEDIKEQIRQFSNSLPEWDQPWHWLSMAMDQAGITSGRLLESMATLPSEHPDARVRKIWSYICSPENRHWLKKRQAEFPTMNQTASKLLDLALIHTENPAPKHD